MDWLKEVAWLLPNWSWLAIALIVIILIIVIAVLAVKSKSNKKSAEAAEPVLMESYEPEALAYGKTEEVKPETKESPVAEDVKRDAKITSDAEISGNKTEEKPVKKTAASKPAKKDETADTTAKKTAASKPVKKDETADTPTKKTAASKPAKKDEPADASAKKTAASKPVKKDEPAAAEPAAAEVAEKKADTKVYHISKRKDDGKWQVKMAKGARAIKLFSTQLEAIDYAKTLADKQEARIVIHKEDGSFRNLTYKKKS